MQRPFLKPFTLVNAGDMSGNIISSPVIINQLPGISFDASWTGTPVGVISVEVSNSVVFNVDGSVKSTGNWNALPGLTLSPAGSASNGFLDVGDTSAYAIRVKYTRTSGTGSMTVVVAGKVL